MILSHLTLTGADDSVDPADLARLSAEAPLIEWGVLFDERSEEPAGRPRFPTRAWRRAFAAAGPAVRRAAHLCGATLLARLAAAQDAGQDTSHGASDALLGELHGPGGSYQRLQLNFYGPQMPAPVLDTWAAASRAQRWRGDDGRPLTLITQHNEANTRVHERFLDSAALAVAEAAGGAVDAATHYTVLFDASGGRGTRPAAWPQRLPGVRCGYAGGLEAAVLPEALAAIERAAGPEAAVWIDIETGLRSGERFDLDRVRAVLAALREQAGGAALVPGLRIALTARSPAP